MSLDDFEFKQTMYLGHQVSGLHEFFKEISKLGFKDAEDYALLECMKGFFPGFKETIEGFQAIIELTGMATFLKHTKELTRLAMIIGQTGAGRKYGES